MACRTPNLFPTIHQRPPPPPGPPVTYSRAGAPPGLENLEGPPPHLDSRLLQTLFIPRSSPTLAFISESVPLPQAPSLRPTPGPCSWTCETHTRSPDCPPRNRGPRYPILPDGGAQIPSVAPDLGLRVPAATPSSGARAPCTPYTCPRAQSPQPAPP